MVTRLALILVLLCASGAAVSQELQGPGWNGLSREQQGILSPLAPPAWDTLTKIQKDRLIAAARHYPKESPAEQARFKEHLIDWAKLPKDKRDRARANFKSFHELPPDKKEAIKNQWSTTQMAPEGVSP